MSELSDIMTGKKEIPPVSFIVRDGSIDYKMSSVSLFSGKRILLLGGMGAFKRADTEMLNDFDDAERYGELVGNLENCVDEVFFTTVNDAWVMDEWFKANDIKHLKMLPDGNGFFAEKIGMLKSFYERGMAYRSLRYAIIIDDNTIVKAWVENNPTIGNPEPYYKTRPEHIVTWMIEDHFQRQKDGKEFKNRKENP